MSKQTVYEVRYKPNNKLVSIVVTPDGIFEAVHKLILAKYGRDIKYNVVSWSDAEQSASILIQGTEFELKPIASDFEGAILCGRS